MRQWFSFGKCIFFATGTVGLEELLETEPRLTQSRGAQQPGRDGAWQGLVKGRGAAGQATLGPGKPLTVLPRAGVKLRGTSSHSPLPLARSHPEVAPV